MLGVYDYTVILTYISVLSAGIGIVFSSEAYCNPTSIICLMLCGFLDAFDGKVARTKKNRTEFEKKFGIQIDSLSDVIAFGVLPATIGINLILHSQIIDELFKSNKIFAQILCIFPILFILCAVIRLAHFNVSEEIRQKEEEGNRKYYSGVPVTSTAIVFPVIYLVQLAIKMDLSLIYALFTIIVGIAFISTIKIKKPTFKILLIFIFAGVLETAVILFLKIRG